MNKGIALFVYDFPHKKSCDFLLRLVLNNLTPDLVIGAPFKKLNINKSQIKISHSFSDNIHPKHICEKLGINYVSTDHNSNELEHILLNKPYKLGIIGGARIIKKHIIDAFELGILNFHPGLIPENRGLDNIQYSIYRDIPMGVTSHLIDENVDLGSILEKYIVPIYYADQLVDIDLRIKEVQNNLLVSTVDTLLSRGLMFNSHQILNYSKFDKNIAGSKDVDEFVLGNWPKYRLNWCSDFNGWKCICGQQIFDFICPSCGRNYDEQCDVLKLLHEPNNG